MLPIFSSDMVVPATLKSMPALKTLFFVFALDLNLVRLVLTTDWIILLRVLPSLYCQR